MAHGYCMSCRRNVRLKRCFGLGTPIALLCTLGWWLVALPFYAKRCPVCKRSSTTISEYTAVDEWRPLITAAAIFVGMAILFSLLLNRFIPAAALLAKFEAEDWVSSMRTHPVLAAVPAAEVKPTAEAHLAAEAQPMPQSQQLRILDAGRLIDTYKQNEAAADSELRGYKLAIRGKIANIARDYLVLGTDVGGIRAVFSKSRQNELSNARRGTTIVLTGTAKGILQGGLQLEDCRMLTEPEIRNSIDVQ